MVLDWFVMVSLQKCQGLKPSASLAVGHVLRKACGCHGDPKYCLLCYTSLLLNK